MKRRVPLIILAATVFSAALFYVLYQTDNKYTRDSPQAEQGVLRLTDGGTPLMYLIDGWEFYQHQLLSPADWEADAPEVTAYVYIGQYLGFDMDDMAADSYGSATYRLTILTGLDTPRSYTLELPEIFSAYSLWINGELLARNGSPDPSDYRPELSWDSITFTAGDRIEIILAVTNFGHYYSGLTYPPAFGQIRAVNKVVSASVIVTAICCFFTVAVGLFYLFLGRFTRERKTAAVFGLLCFAYAGSASHGLVHFVSSGYFPVWYAIEDICFYLLLAGFVYVSSLLFQKKPARVIPIIGASIGTVAVLVPYIFAGSSAFWGLSIFVGCYKLAVVISLFTILIRASEKHSAALLASIVVFAVSLAVDTFTLYEPMRFGWPAEIGGFVMVCTLGVLITLDAAAGLRERLRLTVQNERLGLSYELLTQKIEQAKRIGHDVRHHMAVLDGYVQVRDMAGAEAYISAYTKSLPANDNLHFARNPSVDAAVRYYYNLAKTEGVDVSLNIDLPESAIPEQDLCVLFGNLLENALEACRRLDAAEKYIRFAVSRNEGFITVVSDNSFDGKMIGEGGALHSRKRPGPGIGTASIKAIAEKYGGYSEFSAEGREFRVSVVLRV